MRDPDWMPGANEGGRSHEDDEVTISISREDAEGWAQLVLSGREYETRFGRLVSICREATR